MTKKKQERKQYSESTLMKWAAEVDPIDRGRKAIAKKKPVKQLSAAQRARNQKALDELFNRQKEAEALEEKLSSYNEQLVSIIRDIHNLLHCNRICPRFGAEQVVIKIEIIIMKALCLI